MAGDVITTGTKAADPARVDAPRGNDPVIDAEQAEAGAADVPGGRAADGAAATPASPQASELPKTPESPADDTVSARKPPPASTGAKQLTDGCPSAQTADLRNTGLPVSSPRG